MRYDETHKEKTRARVLREAARIIRAEGPDRVGVAAIMAKAGLTHGGFYAHFPSKAALLAAAVDEMFKDAAGMMSRAVEGRDAPRALVAYIDAYLSRSHLERRGGGCPVAALVGDLPRLKGDARLRYEEGVLRMTRGLEALLEAAGVAPAGPAARSMVSELVGALSIARALTDSEAADRVLDASRATLKLRFSLETPS